MFLFIFRYVKSLENIVTKTCQDFKVYPTNQTETGVWVGDMKICALGMSQ